MINLRLLNIISIACLVMCISHENFAQGYTLHCIQFLSAAPSFQSPAEELELLPDTSSYYITEELYNADTLTSVCTAISFSNYRDSRYQITTSIDGTYHEIINWRNINDSLSVQTISHMYRSSVHVDSVLVWWKDNLITHATKIWYNGDRVTYQYQYEKSKLVNEKIHDLNNGDSEVEYTYLGDNLAKMVITGDHEKQEVEFQYTDTLITISSISEGRSGVYHIKSLTHLDYKGRILSENIYMKRPKEEDLKIYQSEEYSYSEDGNYRKIVTQHKPEIICFMEYDQSYLPKEVWTWEGSDQVWVRKHY